MSRRQKVVRFVLHCDFIPKTHTCSSILQHTGDSVNVWTTTVPIPNSQPRTHCIVDFFYFQMCGLSSFIFALLWPAVRCHQFNVIGYLYQQQQKKNASYFPFLWFSFIESMLGTLGDLLSGLINKWCSIYDVKVSCRIFFSVRIDFRRCIFCAPQQQQQHSDNVRLS